MEKPVQELLDAGQSVWIDNLRRSMFAPASSRASSISGVRGMTSNPTIFEKAIGAGNDYDEQLATLIGSEKNADALFWDLAVADIQSACDAFAPVYASSNGNDGFVSLEVSPLLAHDTAGTIAMVEELWKRVNRPNVMIKIPGTKEGLPAIEESIYRGYNINVTLIFSVEMYERAARAYVKGLERRVAEGKPIDKIRSVNSVFVSRIDTAIDKLLQERIAKGEKLEHSARQDGHRRAQAHVSKVQGDLSSATSSRRCARRARRCSGRCGPRHRRRTPTIPTSCMSRASWDATRSTRCRLPRSTR